MHKTNSWADAEDAKDAAPTDITANILSNTNLNRDMNYRPPYYWIY